MKTNYLFYKWHKNIVILVLLYLIVFSAPDDLYAKSGELDPTFEQGDS